MSFILASSFFILQAQEENRPSTHQMFLNQYKSWQKEHPEYFQLATTSEALGTTPLRPKATPLRKEIFGYMPYWMLAQLNIIDYSLLSTIAYFDVEINGNGDVTTDDGWSLSSTVTTLINNARAAGVRVVLSMTNFTASQISSIINTPSIKKKVIDNLYLLVAAQNGGGVNIDFENIPSGNRDSVTSFMRDVATIFHTGRSGSHVSSAPTDYDFRQEIGM